MTLHEFNKVGDYISRKTNKDTSFYTSIGKIENDEFKYVWFFRNICCIRHKNDNQKRSIQYKTYNGAKKYIDKWLEKSDK